MNFVTMPKEKPQLPGGVRQANSADSMIAIFGLALLVPGFVIYQYALYLGLIPPFLQGYLGPMSLVVTVILLPFAIVSFVRGRSPYVREDAIFQIFIMLFLSVSTYHLSMNNEYENALSKITAIPQIIAYYLVYRLIDLDSRSTQLFIGISMFLTAFVIYNLELGSFSAVNVNYTVTASSKDHLSNYQFFAIAYLFCFISLVPAMRNRLFRWSAYFVSSWLLYINGARSEFLIIFMAALMIEILISKNKLLIFVLLIYGSALLLFSLDNILGFVGTEDRVAALILERGGDASVVERIYSLNHAVATISESPILGDYSNHEIGEYAHNILSVWVDYGLLGLTVFALGLLFSVGRARIAFMRGDQSVLAISTAAMAISGAMFFLFAKAYFHPMFGAMLGLGAQYGKFGSYPGAVKRFGGTGK